MRPSRARHDLAVLHTNLEVTHFRFRTPLERDIELPQFVFFLVLESVLRETTLIFRRSLREGQDSRRREVLGPHAPVASASKPVLSIGLGSYDAELPLRYMSESYLCLVFFRRGCIYSKFLEGLLQLNHNSTEWHGRSVHCDIITQEMPSSQLFFSFRGVA